MADEIVKTCTGLEVRSIDVKTPAVHDTNNSAPAIEVVPQQPSSALGGARKAVTVIAVGPVLDVTASPTLETDIACTPKGFALTTTITRTAVAVLANVLWRPRITMTVVLHRPEVIFESTWKMRLPTGAEPDQVQTPPYSDQKYPITVAKTIR